MESTQVVYVVGKRPTNWERCAIGGFPKLFQAWNFTTYSGVVDGAIMLGKGTDVLAAPPSVVTLVLFGTAPLQTFRNFWASPRSCICVYVYMCICVILVTIIHAVARRDFRKLAERACVYMCICVDVCFGESVVEVAVYMFVISMTIDNEPPLLGDYGCTHRDRHM